MSRYVISPRAALWVEDEMDCGPSNITNLDVIESGPIETGLFDQYGNAIFRVKDPIGFQIDG